MAKDNNGQHDMRGVQPIVMDADRGFAKTGRCGLALPALQVAGEVGKEGTGDLYSDLVTPLEEVAGHRPVHIDLVDPARPEQLAALFPVTITGAYHVGTGAHEVPGRAVGGDVVEPHPQIKVAARATDEDLRVDGAGDLGVCGERLTVESEQVIA